MTLEALMEKFADLPHSDIGRGPLHPTNPQTELSHDLKIYLEVYPFLRWQNDYLKLLQLYAGAGLSPPSDSVPRALFRIFGIGPYAEDADLLLPNGYYCFSTCIIDDDFPVDCYETAYYFNSRTPIEPTVYAHKTAMKAVDFGPIRPLYRNFLEFLTVAIAAKGFLRLPPPD